jgi:hypothetical protein
MLTHFLAITMTHPFHPSTELLDWLLAGFAYASLALSLASLWLLVAKGHWKAFPSITFLSITRVLAPLVSRVAFANLSPIRSPLFNPISVLFSCGTVLLNATIAAAAAFECYSRFFKFAPSFREFWLIAARRAVFIFLVIALACSATDIELSAYQRVKYGGLEVSLALVAACLLIVTFVLLTMASTRVNIRTRDFGMNLGLECFVFGLLAQAGYMLYMFRVGEPSPLVETCSGIAYLLAFLIWVLYLTLPEVSYEPPVLSAHWNLYRWNEICAALQHLSRLGDGVHSSTIRPRYNFWINVVDWLRCSDQSAKLSIRFRSRSQIYAVSIFGTMLLALTAMTAYVLALDHPRVLLLVAVLIVVIIRIFVMDRPPAQMVGDFPIADGLGPGTFLTSVERLFYRVMVRVFQKSPEHL